MPTAFRFRQGLFATYIVAFLDHFDRDQVVVHAGRVGVDAGEVDAVIVAAVPFVVAAVSDLTRALTAVSTVVVF